MNQLVAEINDCIYQMTKNMIAKGIANTQILVINDLVF